MSASHPTNLTFDSIAEFHQQLLRLHQAGLRLQLDESAPADDLPAKLNEYMAQLVSHASKYSSLDLCVSEASFLPQRYRLALQTWCKCDRPSESLSILRVPVQQDAEGSIDLRFALLLPTIIFTLIYIASFYLLLVTVPRMEAVYLQLNELPSLPVRWLIAVRDAMPYWGPGLPVLFVITACLLFTGRLTLPRWLPGRWQSYKYLSASLLAQNLASQIECEVQNESTAGPPSSTNNSAWQSLLQNPMLRWALAGPQSEALLINQSDNRTPALLNAAQRSRRLRLAANLYETMHAIRAQQFRGWLILLSCIFLGGGLVLIYGLALFAPLIQLLRDVVG